MEDRILDTSTGLFVPVVKAGITNDIERRRREYEKCGNKNWMYYWDTDCVRVTGEPGPFLWLICADLQ